MIKHIIQAIGWVLGAGLAYVGVCWLLARSAHAEEIPDGYTAVGNTSTGIRFYADLSSRHEYRVGDAVTITTVDLFAIGGTFATGEFECEAISEANPRTPTP
jgi:hypothetical protein